MRKLYYILFILIIACSAIKPKFKVGDCATGPQMIYSRKILKIDLDNEKYVYEFTPISGNIKVKRKAEMRIRNFDKIMQSMKCLKEI